MWGKYTRLTQTVTTHIYNMEPETKRPRSETHTEIDTLLKFASKDDLKQTLGTKDFYNLVAIVEQKTGNSADINLFLIAILIHTFCYLVRL